MDIFDLHGKVALVTGGGSGLGQAIAVGLAQAGADVAFVVNSSSGEQTRQSIENSGRHSLVIQADIGKDQHSDVIDKTLEQFGRIDILVNNAGIVRRKAAAEISLQDWHDVMDINLHAAFALCQLAGREMINQGSGKIINVASVLSFQGGINVPGYAASKHALAGLTKALANEWASKGVNVNAIAPGYMVTSNTSALRADEARNKQIQERIPAGRWGVPADLAGPAVFLASSASDYMHGHILTVDGGWMAR